MQGPGAALKEREGFQSVWDPTKMRTREACKRCHHKRAKCDGQRPCCRCRRVHTKCIYRQAEGKGVGLVTTTNNVIAVEDDGGGNENDGFRNSISDKMIFSFVVI
ncbi:hypothetical protein BC936DRAFT_143018 [Jimgerdemannia flammicorona]|uniref:Zn(2)-C6 fungal-type domain-containing protein n=1 Tax=Jimgerdemannia flammicorona TaxID=994334 RepID=A0A433DED5_9FUNG|nr:hypothetical protein BC936DRAFT_143018 [Jimgerdemannia flammicorona]